MINRVRRGSNGAPWFALKVVNTVIFIFILGPILITAAASFNEANQSKFPPRGFSLKWWADAFSDDWVDPVLFSFRLAICAALVSTIVALPLTFGLTRYRFKGRDALITLALGPLMLPALVISIGLLQFFYLIGLGDYVGFWALLAGHFVICLPFSVRTIAISLYGLPANVEKAAASLGASPVTVLFKVVFPLIKNGILAGAVFSFIHSFSDVNVSLFISRPGQMPVSVKILGFLEFGFAPTLAAVAILTMIIPLVLIIAIERFGGLGDFIYGERARG